LVSAPASAQRSLDYLELFSSAAEWFAVTAARVDADAVVAACPGWTAYDLVAHLGNIHSWAATVVETGESAAEQDDQPPTRKGRTIAEWYAGKAEDLYEVLRASDPEQQCWNFAHGTGTVAFWHRRQLHETVMHGVDLALAAGMAPQLDPFVSADAIDETLHVFLQRMHARGYPAALTAPVTLVARDVDRSWTLLPTGAVPEVVDGTRPGDRISADAGDLLKLLWKRGDGTGVHLDGDLPRIHAFLASRLTA
jgi:uncharacterized protein (TIGR03083 family)